MKEATSLIVICLVSVALTLTIRVAWLIGKWIKNQIDRHMEIMENIDSFLWFETEWGKDRRKLKEQKGENQ